LNNELLPNQLPPLRHDRSDDLLLERALPVRGSLVADATIKLKRRRWAVTTSVRRGIYTSSAAQFPLWTAVSRLLKRLDGLEAALAPEGRPFMIWAMINGRGLTIAEIDAAFQEAISSGRASSGDNPLAISWTVD
jgi:hypothetical protein